MSRRSFFSFLQACLAFACSLVFFGCATPATYTTQALQRFDKNTEYRVDDENDGFTITVIYTRYQFIPESDAVAMAGKSALLSIAHDVADERGRPIEQINEQRIRMSMGRNGLSGITTWSGTVKAFYRKTGD